MEPPHPSAPSSGLNIKTSKLPSAPALITCGSAQARKASSTANTTQSIPEKKGHRPKPTALRPILKKTGNRAPLRSAKEGIDYSALPTMRSLNKRLARANLNAKRSTKKKSTGTTIKGTTIELASAKPRSTFPFLALPPELRDMVYVEIASSTSATLSSKPRRRMLLNTSPLLATSRQIRGEYASILSTHATPIITTVTNFNFNHVVRFLNRLSDRELNALPSVAPSVAAPLERQFIIRLDGNEECPSNPEGLQDWLLRCENPDKKGSKMETTYMLHDDQMTSLFKYDRLPGQYMLNRDYRRLQPLLKVGSKIDQWLKKLEPGRLRDEAKKVRDAMDVRILLRLAYHS